MSSVIDQDPLRIGIVGLGRQGCFHLERLSLREDCVAIGLYDHAKIQPGPPAVWKGRLAETWGEFLADPELELVLIATPAATHVRLACEALAAGKHVVLEKPMCLNSTEADTILAAAERAERIVSVIHARRWESDFRTAAALLQSGKLGRLRSVKWVMRQFSPPLERDSQTASAPSGGGVLLDYGSHAIDQLLQLIETPVQSIQARITSSGRAGAVVDEFEMWIQFEHDVTAQLELSLNSLAPLETGWILNGDQGGYVAGRYYRATTEGELVDAPVEVLLSDPDAYYAALVRHLRFGDSLPVSGQESRRVLALIDAARQAASSGDRLRVSL